MSANRLEYRWDKGFSSVGEKNLDVIESECFEQCWCCGGSMGSVTFRRIRIGRGFDLWITDCRFSRNTFISFYDTPPSLFFGIYLSGKYAFNLGLRNPRMKIEMSSEQQYIMHINDPNGFSEIKIDEPLRHISIMIRPEWFAGYFKDDMSILPRKLRKIAENSSVDDFMYAKSITPAARMALRQIMNCPLRGAARRLFLEGRALEIVACQLGQIPDASPPPAVFSSGVHPGDRERIEFARDFLLAHLDDPPSLMELARTAGMSHPKLNRCFRRMYGMTVFQCLRDERLRRSRTMLEEQGLTVTETAYAVGYESISHFSQAYKKYFGVSPSAFAKKADSVQGFSR